MGNFTWRARIEKDRLAEPHGEKDRLLSRAMWRGKLPHWYLGTTVRSVVETSFPLSFLHDYITDFNANNGSVGSAM